MEMAGHGFQLRPWRRGDEPALVRHADNRNIWINLRDRFPHPFTADAARAWIDQNEAHQGPPLNLAIEVDGEAAGGVGLEPLGDVFRHTAEIGYWLAEAHWGRGIVTEALRLTTAYAFDAFAYERLEAGVFEWNPASARVLEKAGYVLEGRHRRAVVKDGRMGDILIYARLRAQGPDRPEA